MDWEGPIDWPRELSTVLLVNTGRILLVGGLDELGEAY